MENSEQFPLHFALQIVLFGLELEPIDEQQQKKTSARWARPWLMTHCQLITEQIKISNNCTTIQKIQSVMIIRFKKHHKM